MCGRYTLTTLVEKLAKFFSLPEDPALEPRYDIAPTQPCDLRVMSPTGSFPRSAASMASYRFGRSLETQFMITMVTMVTMVTTFLGPN